MLIDFTVENYRSIKDPVTLSAIAQPSRDSGKASAAKRRIKSDNEIAPSAPVLGRDFELLPVLAIFGANASGKSNVLRALHELLMFMAHGGPFLTPGPTVMLDESVFMPFAPFRLDQTTSQRLTRFQIRLALRGDIFVYQLALDGLRIHHERLDHIPPPPKRTPRVPLFERTWQEADQEYIWINGSRIGNAYREIQVTLRDYKPFISLLIRTLKVPALQYLAIWLLSRLPTLEMSSYEIIAPTVLIENSEQLASVEALIRRFDTGIAQIEIVEQEAAQLGYRNNRVYVWHNTPQGPVRWLLSEESTGTQRLFSFAPFLLRCLNTGSLFLIDELDASLHPHITRRIVEMFQSIETNPKRAQLIFTSHDNTLQRNNLLRRDQIWFTEKRPDGSTDLFPLSDFHPRNDLAIDKAYLDGRFGAVPNLREMEDDNDLVGAER